MKRIILSAFFCIIPLFSYNCGATNVDYSEELELMKRYPNPTRLHAVLMSKPGSERAQELIRTKVDINTKAGAAGETPLHTTMDTVDLVCFRLLLEQGADLSIRNNRGQTPYMLADHLCKYFEDRKGLYLDRTDQIEGIDNLLATILQMKALLHSEQENRNK